MKKDVVARELTREIIVGAFMVLVFLGLACFTIILSREAWFRQKHRMEVVFKDVMGLREGDSVVVRGMPAGKVYVLELEQDRVRLVLSLDQPLHMRKDYLITVVPTSILGGRSLQIHEGSPEHAELPLDSLFVGRDPYDLIADTAELINSAKRSFLGEDGILRNIQRASGELRDLMARVSAGEGALGKLVAADSTLYDDLEAVAASLKAVSQRLEQGEGTLGKLMSGDDTLYRDLTAVVASLREVTDNIQQGKGVLGRLLQDEGLYTELEGVLEEVRAAVDDFRETAPVVTFTSIFFGAF